MAADEQVAQVLRAMEILEGRVRAPTATEIGRLTAMEPIELGQVLRRAVVGGWAVRLIVRSGAERSGVRLGTAVYRLTDMASHRAGAGAPLATASAE